MNNIEKLNKAKLVFRIINDSILALKNVSTYEYENRINFIFEGEYVFEGCNDYFICCPKSEKVTFYSYNRIINKTVHSTRLQNDLDYKKLLIVNNLDDLSILIEHLKENNFNDEIINKVETMLCNYFNHLESKTIK